MSDPSQTNAPGAAAATTGHVEGGEFAIRDTVSPPPGPAAPPPGSEPLDVRDQGPASAPASSDPLVGQVLAGRYRITRLLGKGGMGAVYHAEHVHMRKAVALKVLHREMTVLSEVVARFEREAIAAARIEHVNVAAATDFGRLEDGACYLVLEYVEGRSLSDALEAEGPFDSARAVHIARQVAEALAAAHAAGVVHRDLKPDNIMLVERDGGRDFAKVLDFGIAKLRSDEASEGQQVLTQIGAVFGTPEYMSPEQAKGEPVDARSDLYTLGMILYEMLAGQTAFGSEELIAVLMKHVTAEPPPLPGHVPPALRELVKRLLRKKPAERVQSAGELAALLGQLEFAPKPQRGHEAFRSFSILQRARREIPAVLRRRIEVAGRAVPLWTLAVSATLVSMAVTLGVASRTPGSDASAEPSIGEQARRLATAVLDPELPALMTKAKAGDREALSALRKRADEGAGVEVWVALGRGYARIGLHAASAEAYGRALASDPALAENEQLLVDLREAAEHNDSFEQAMDVALTAMGPVGADFIEAIVREGQGSAAALAHAKKLMVEPSFLRNASPALGVALALAGAKTCSDYKELLPRALDHADERSLSKLRPLTVTRGCGFLGIRDCHACLRAKAVPLKEAIEAATNRPPPSFPRKPASAGAGAQSAAGTSKDPAGTGAPSGTARTK